MKTFLKVIFGLLILLVIVVGAAAVVLPKYVDPNDYKDQVTARVEKATGRKLTLAGDLKLSVFPWLGVDAGKVSLGNARGFGDQPMFSAEKLAVRVRLTPLLLNRALLVDTVMIQGANIRLTRNKQGVTNFDDLTGGKDRGKVQLAALVLNGLNVRDSQLSWDDQQQGKRYSVRDLSLSTGELAIGSAIPIDLSGRFDAPPAGLAGDIDLKGDLTIDKDAQRFKLAPLTVTGQVKGKAIPGGASDLKLTTALDLDLKAGTASLADLVLNAIGSEIKGSVEARDIQSETPAAKGRIALASDNGPGLVGALTGKPAKGGAEALKLAAAFDVDLKSGVARVSGLSAQTVDSDIKGDLDARNIKGKDSTVAGKLSLTSADLSALLAAYGQAQLPVQLRNVTGAATVSGTAQKFRLDPISLTANVAGEKLPKGDNPFKLSTRADVDMDKQTLATSDLSVEALGLNARGNLAASGILKEPRYNGTLKVAAFNLRQLLVQLGQTLPQMADPQALTQVAMDTQLAGGTRDLSLSGMNLLLDGSKVRGDLAIANIADPAITFKLAIDALNVDRYLPPKKEAKAGEVAVTATAPGGAAAAAAATELPVDTLRKLKVKGDASIGSLIIRSARLSNVRASIDARDGNIQFTPAADLYEGKYSGNISLNASGKDPVLKLNESLTGVQVEPLLKDLRGKSKLRGKGEVSARLTAIGTSTEAMKRTLAGEAAFAFRNGAYKGINLGKLLRQAQSGFVASVSEQEETDFSEMTGTVQFAEGVASNQDLQAKSPLLRVEGKGRANLVTEQIDYTLYANVVASAGGQGGEELAKLSGVNVPIKISGTFEDPKFAPDVAGIAKARAQKELQKRLDKTDKLPEPAKQLLRGVLGGGQEAPAEKEPAPAQPTEGQTAPPEDASTEVPAAPQQTEPQSTPQQQQAAPEKPKSPEEQAKEQLEDAMKKLLNF